MQDTYLSGAEMVIKGTNGDTLGYWVISGLEHRCIKVDTLKRILSSGVKINNLEIVNGEIVHNADIGTVDLSDWEEADISGIHRVEGLELQNMAKNTDNRICRNVVGGIMGYLLDSDYTKVFMLTGMEHTGKTRCLQQAIAKHIYLDKKSTKIVFLSIERKIKCSSLVRVLEEYEDTFIFIDNAHNIEDLVGLCLILPDIICMDRHVKIVMAVDKVLCHLYRGEPIIYNKAIVRDSTYITYSEYLDINGEEPCNSSYESYRDTAGLCYSAELSNRGTGSHVVQEVINGIASELCQDNMGDTADVERYRKQISVVIDKARKSIGSTIRYIPQNKMSIGKIIAEGIRQGKSDNQIKGDIPNSAGKANIVSMLMDIGVIIPLHNCNNCDKKSAESKLNKQVKLVSTVPFLAVGVKDNNDTVRGKLNENIVLMNLKLALGVEQGVADVCYLKYSAKKDGKLKPYEIDAVIKYMNGDVTLVEVKSSDSKEKKNALNYAETDNRVDGKILRRIMVYSGKTDAGNSNRDNREIDYVNIVDFLSNMDKYIGIEGAD